MLTKLIFSGKFAYKKYKPSILISRIIKTTAFKRVAVIIVVTAVIIIYLILDPACSKWFPGCIFKSITGYECPGCGSQRVVHNLLNLRLKEAFKAKALLVILIPYIIVGLIFDLLRHGRSRSVHLPGAIFFGKIAIIILIVTVILFTVIRNTTFYHNLISGI